MPALSQKFTLTFTGKKTEDFTKEQIVNLINFEEKLTTNEDWQMYVALTQWEPLAMMHIVLDVEEKLKIVSLVFQADNMAPTDLENAVARMKADIAALKLVDGTHYTDFVKEYDDVHETWKGISIEKGSDMEESLEANRSLLVESVLAHTAARFDPLFNSEIFIASKSLEHRTWPVADDDALRTHGNSSISILIKQFSDLDCMNDFDEAEAMHQWERLKFETRTLPFFKHTTYRQFWEHLLANYDKPVVVYSEVLKIAVLVLLIITDSSCCERSYSLMNRIHTGVRNRLGIRTLRDLMCICSLGPELKDYDPKPVLKSWLESKNWSLSKIRRQIMGHDDSDDSDEDDDEDEDEEKPNSGR